MMNDGDAVAAFLADRAPLHARLRVLARVLISAFGQRNAFQPDAEPRVVHHDKHVLEATVLLADEIADRAFAVSVRKHAGRARVDAHLVLDRHAFHIVALAETTIVVDHELRHDKERDALYALGAV